MTIDDPIEIRETNTSYFPAGIYLFKVAIETPEQCVKCVQN